LRAKLGPIVPTSSVLGNVSDYMVERYGFDADCRVVAFTGDNPSSLAGLEMRRGEIGMSIAAFHGILNDDNDAFSRRFEFGDVGHAVHVVGGRGRRGEHSAGAARPYLAEPAGRGRLHGVALVREERANRGQSCYSPQDFPATSLGHHDIFSKGHSDGTHKLILISANFETLKSASSCTCCSPTSS